MSHGGKPERGCSVLSRVGVVGLTGGGERLLMMSRRSRAGDRPLAYPPHLLLFFFFFFVVVFVFIVLAAETERAAIMVQRTCMYFHFPYYRARSGNGVSESFPERSPAGFKVVLYVHYAYIHVCTYTYRSMYWYGTVHPQPFSTKIHFLQVPM